MGAFVSAGSYFRELDFSEYAPLLSTSIPGFVGTAIKGPINVPTYVTSLDQAIEIFGQPTPDSYLMYAVKTAWEKIDKAWIIRICGGSSNGSPYTSAAKASVDIEGEASLAFERSSNFEMFTIAASSSGTHTGTELENFIIVLGVNDGFSVRVDTGAGFGAAQTVVIPAGTYTAATLSTAINGLTSGINCTDDGNGYLKVDTSVAGSDQRFELLVVGGTDSYITLGLTTGVYTGTDGTDYLEVTMTGAGAGTETFTLTAGNRTAAQVAIEIDALAVGFDCIASDAGGVDLFQKVAGSANTLQVAVASSCDAVFGWDNAIHSGTDGTSTTTTITAATEGTWANYIEECPGLYVTILDGTVSGFAIEVYTANDVLKTKFDNLSKDPNDDNYYVDIVGIDNNYITITDVITVSSDPINGNYNLAMGANGISDVIDADYIGTVTGNDRYGLQLFSNPESIDINILAVPGMTSEAIHSEMLSICENDRRDCFAVLDGPYDLSVQQIVDFHNGTGSYSSRTALNNSYGAIYYDWVRIYDEYNPDINDGDRWIPPCGFIISVMAYTDFIADTWWAPAGPVRGRLGTALELGHSPDQGERDLMQSGGNAVNPLVDFTGEGISVYGQHTLQRRDTSLKYINVRRMMLYAEKVVATSVKYLVFEQNDAVTWRRYTRLVNPIFETIKRRRGLYDFKVVCDSTTNPSDQISQGMMRGKILLQPTISAEILVTDFVLIPTGASFSEF